MHGSFLCCRSGLSHPVNNGYDVVSADALHPVAKPRPFQFTYDKFLCLVLCVGSVAHLVNFVQDNVALALVVCWSVCFPVYGNEASGHKCATVVGLDRVVVELGVTAPYVF